MKLSQSQTMLMLAVVTGGLLLAITFPHTFQNAIVEDAGPPIELTNLSTIDEGVITVDGRFYHVTPFTEWWQQEMERMQKWKPVRLVKPQTQPEENEPEE